MSNVFFIYNVLPVDLILQIKNYVNKEQPELTNHNGWDPRIVHDSARVDVFRLNHTPFNKHIINCYADYVDLEKHPLTHVNYYKWHPGSFIPFHNDGVYAFSSSIYLNESWDRDYGGLFLYEKGEDLKAYVPKYNSAVINNKNILHGTSISSPTSPIRETIQIFFE